MRDRVTLDIHPGITHLFELRPSNRFAADVHIIRVNKHRERVPELLQDRPRNRKSGHITIVDRYHGAFGGNRFFSAPPRQKIFHWNDRDAVILQLFHLGREIPRARLPRSRADYLRTGDSKTRSLWPNDRSRAAAWVSPSPAPPAPKKLDSHQTICPPVSPESNFFYNPPLTAAGQGSAGEYDEAYRLLSAQIITFQSKLPVPKEVISCQLSVVR